jgi:cell division protein FtsZ
VQPQQRRPEPEARVAEERPRFGINSLINRMTGHSAETERAQPAARPSRQQPTMGSAQPQQAPARAHDEDEQIEIPAFLRRQAN